MNEKRQISITKRVIFIAVGLLMVVGVLAVVVPQISGGVTELSTVTEEVVAEGDGVEVTFPFQLERYPIEISGADFQIYDDTEVFTDDGDGTLTGDGGGSGTITYTTGAGSVTFFVAVTDNESIFADYNPDDVPVVMTLIANYWWVGLIIVFVAVIMNSKAGRKLLRRRRRR